MGLGLYDADRVAITLNSSLQAVEPLRTVHNGRNGGAWETLLHLRNDNPALYYHAITVEYEAENNIDAGPLGNTGWSIKLASGSRQPNEAEWDQVTSGASLALPDIGTADEADTTSYSPFWVRVYCPGETPAQLRVGQNLKINYFEASV